MDGKDYGNFAGRAAETVVAAGIDEKIVGKFGGKFDERAAELIELSCPRMCKDFKQIDGEFVGRAAHRLLYHAEYSH